MDPSCRRCEGRWRSPGYSPPLSAMGECSLTVASSRTFPTQALKDMGADVIIAVDLTPPVTHGADSKIADRLARSDHRRGATRQRTAEP